MGSWGVKRQTLKALNPGSLEASTLAFNPATDPTRVLADRHPRRCSGTRPAGRWGVTSAVHGRDLGSRARVCRFSVRRFRV